MERRLADGFSVGVRKHPSDDRYIVELVIRSHGSATDAGIITSMITHEFSSDTEAAQTAENLARYLNGLFATGSMPDFIRGETECREAEKDFEQESPPNCVERAIANIAQVLGKIAAPKAPKHIDPAMPSVQADRAALAVMANDQEDSYVVTIFLGVGPHQIKFHSRQFQSAEDIIEASREFTTHFALLFPPEICAECHQPPAFCKHCQEAAS
jgi:hypothetical protein